MWPGMAWRRARSGQDTEGPRVGWWSRRLCGRPPQALPFCPQAAQVPALLQAAQEHQWPRQEQVGLERPPWQCLPGAAPADGQSGLRNPVGGDTWQPLGPGLSPYTCSLCAHQPASLCPPPTAALWPSWRRRRWPTGHLHSSELSDNFSPATAAQLCPTLASWGSEPSPGAAAVIYKANFIKFVTIPWFPCREGHPLAAWLCQAQDCLPGLFTNETTLSIPRGGAPACVASRGQQSAGPAGKGQFLAGKQVRAGPAIPSVSAMPPAVLRTPPTPVHCRKPGPQPHRRGHHWAGTGRPGPVGLLS